MIEPETDFTFGEEEIISKLLFSPNERGFVNDKSQHEFLTNVA